MTNTQTKTARLAKMAMLVAISIVLVAIVRFPVFPAVAFLEYDPADIPILIGTFAFGPIAGILLTVVTSVLQGVTVSSASGAYGIIMHIIATCTLVIGGGTYARSAKNVIAYGALFPGDPDLMHQKNECISVERLIQMTKIYAEAIYKLASGEYNI